MEDVISGFEENKLFYFELVLKSGKLKRLQQVPEFEARRR